jgi:FtsZ-interacting cell division protein ZipA
VGAGAALVVGILTQWWTDRRDNQRWEREREDRRMQWEREREDRREQWQREDSLRWLQDRQQAYAQFLSAHDEWDTTLSAARASRNTDIGPDMGMRPELDSTKIAQARMAARRLLPLLEFMAPKQTRELARSAVTTRTAFQLRYLTTDVTDVAKMDAGWAQVRESTSSLLKAMRNDLGVEIALEDADT